MKDDEFADYSGAEREIKWAIEEFRAVHPEPAPIRVEISALLEFDDDDGRERDISVILEQEQCQQFYGLAETNISEAMKFLFESYLRMPWIIKNTKVRIRKR